MSTDQLEISEEELKAATRDFTDFRMIGVLVTGPADNRNEWGDLVWPDVIDGRKKTTRCRLWASGSLYETLYEAVEAAKTADVTLQLLCCWKPIEATREHIKLGGGASVTVREMQETYPVCHVGTHKMIWRDTSRAEPA